MCFSSGKVWIKKKVFRGPDGESAKAARQQRRAQVPYSSPGLARLGRRFALNYSSTSRRAHTLDARSSLQAAAKRNAAPKRTPLEGEARMTILYGTQTGHSKTFALELAQVSWGHRPPPTASTEPRPSGRAAGLCVPVCSRRMHSRA